MSENLLVRLDLNVGLLPGEQTGTGQLCQFSGPYFRVPPSPVSPNDGPCLCAVSRSERIKHGMEHMVGDNERNLQDHG
ncbi:hypothetical protein RRG08_028357 [Elysia crispata]|uniref:Uncharacterized protein n=1 Tax=Elysia crispata TaxID=231223 RepID=A0AAE1AW82_9GAST|nr:hypothetical protein RRG08_028357 [Elysia crispata]